MRDGHTEDQEAAGTLENNMESVRTHTKELFLDCVSDVNAGMYVQF